MSSIFSNRNVLVGVAVVALAIGLAFGAGVAYGHSSASTSTVSVASSGGSGRFAGGNGNGGGTNNSNNGQGTAGQGRGRPVSGTVKSVDGNTITVSTQNNGDVKVQLSANATVSKTVEASSSDIATGQFVLVRGQQNDDGSITANTISVGPESLVGGGNRFGPNASPSANQ